jgi:hypothetical protein
MPENHNTHFSVYGTMCCCPTGHAAARPLAAVAARPATTSQRRGRCQLLVVAFKEDGRKEAVERVIRNQEKVGGAGPLPKLIGTQCTHVCHHGVGAAAGCCLLLCFRPVNPHAVVHVLEGVLTPCTCHVSCPLPPAMCPSPSPSPAPSHHAENTGPAASQQVLQGPPQRAPGGVHVKVLMQRLVLACCMLMRSYVTLTVSLICLGPLRS